MAQSPHSPSPGQEERRLLGTPSVTHSHSLDQKEKRLLGTPVVTHSHSLNQEQSRLLDTPSRESTEFEDHKSPARIEGALPDLLYGAFLPCVPVVLVSTLLLAIIFTYRVDLDPGWQWLTVSGAGKVSDPSLQNRTLELEATGGDAAYYVRYNPAILVAIASWTSKIIPFLTSSSMAVIAFFAGRRILDASRDDKFGQLPTPHQMSILIKLLNGAGVSPLWDTLVYKFQNHEHLVQPIPLVFGALGFVVFFTLLIGAADTWFAATTRPMIQEQLTRHLTPINTYGRELNSSVCVEDSWVQALCPSNSQAICNYPCNIETWNLTTAGGVTLKRGIKGAQKSAEALLGNSNTNVIQNTSSQGYEENKGAQKYFFLGDVQSGQDLDFLANTVSVTTQCEVVTQNCQLNSPDPGFSCFGYHSPSFTYSGEVGIDPAASKAPDNMTMVGIQFFDDSGLQNPIGFGNQSTKLFGTQNPVYFLTWSKGFPPVDTSKTTFDEMRRNKFLQVDLSGDNVMILNCSTSIYNTMYAWVNGKILQKTQSLAPDTYGAIFSAPFAINSALGHLALENAAALATYKSNPQDLSNQFANEFSRAAVALSAGIMDPATNLLEQSRNNTVLLTRIPKIPLYFLIGVKALYALTSLVLAGLAYLLAGIHEAQEVKARLTVDGLVTGLFESGANQEQAVKKIEQLYEEHKPKENQVDGEEKRNTKVGMKKTEDGGWIWVAGDKVHKAWTTLGIGEVLKLVATEG